jgi:hypothetical protein
MRCDSDTWKGHPAQLARFGSTVLTVLGGLVVGPPLEASRLPVSDTGRRRWHGYRSSAGDGSPRDWLALDHRERRGRLVALGR